MNNQDICPDNCADAFDIRIANSVIKLSYQSNGNAIGKTENVYVFLKRIHICHLFSDVEGETPDQNGQINLTFNGLSTDILWEREDISARPRERYWSPFIDEMPRLLFAGAGGKFMNLSVALIESEDTERLVFEKIADALRIAAQISAAVPGYGTAISAGLALGATIARLIRERFEDDRELSYRGAIGAPDGLELKTGSYSLIRKVTGETVPACSLRGREACLDDDDNRACGNADSDLHHIKIDFEVKTFDDLASNVSMGRTKTKVAVFLESIVLDFDEEYFDWNDVVLIGATITSTPFDVTKKTPTVKQFEFSHPYVAGLGVNSNLGDVPFDAVVKIHDQLLYEGDWQASLAFSLDISGKPDKMTEDEQEAILALLTQTGAVIMAAAPDGTDPAIGAGVEFAKSAASAFLKYQPDTLFSKSKTGMFVLEPDDSIETDPIDGVLFRVPRNKKTVHDIELDLGDFGRATFKLKVITEVDDSIADPAQPEKLLDHATADGPGTAIYWTGGSGTITALGNFGGASVTVQFSPDNSAWFDFVPGEIKLIDEGAAQFDVLGARQYVRAVVDFANSNGPTSVTCFLAKS